MSAEDGLPELSALAAAAVQLHELFTQMVAAGFSEMQALYLVSRIMTGGTS